MIDPVFLKRNYAGVAILIFVFSAFYFLFYAVTNKPYQRFYAWQLYPAAFGEERTEFGSAAFEDKLYLVGGFGKDRKSLDTIVSFDPRIGALEKRRTLFYPVHHPAVAVLGDTIYIAGGFLGDSRRTLKERADFFAFSPRDMSVVKKASLPDANAGLVLVSHNGYLYAIGGQDRNFISSKKSVFRYKPKEDIWEKMGELNYPRNHLSALSVGGKLYVFGGRYYQNISGEVVVKNLDTVEVYDDVNDTWRVLNSRIPRGTSGNAGVAVADRFAVLYGGEELGSAFPDTYIFDTITEQWRKGPSLMAPRHGLGSGFLVGDRIFAVGGSPTYGFGVTEVIEFLDITRDEFLRMFAK